MICDNVILGYIGCVLKWSILIWNMVINPRIGVNPQQMRMPDSQQDHWNQRGQTWYLCRIWLRVVNWLPRDGSVVKQRWSVERFSAIFFIQKGCMEDASCGYLMEVPMHLEIYPEFQVRDQCLETAACVAFLRKIARLLLLLSLSIENQRSQFQGQSLDRWQSPSSPSTWEYFRCQHHPKSRAIQGLVTSAMPSDCHLLQ